MGSATNHDYPNPEHALRTFYRYRNIATGKPPELMAPAAVIQGEVIRIGATRPRQPRRRRRRATAPKAKPPASSAKAEGSGIVEPTMI